MGSVVFGLRGAVFAAAVAVLAGSVGLAPGALARRKSPGPLAILHKERQSSLDLKLTGDLAGLPAGSTRYVRRADLLKLPQVTFTVNRDGNFTRPAQVSGVALEELARRFAASPSTDMVLAICTDRYCAPYTRSYLSAHAPILVLKVNGNSPANWPKDAGGNNMGPYLISNPHFAPSFKILSHSDEPQIPWGVVQIEFRNESELLSAIAPRGPEAKAPLVQDGYRIAQQNCFRCHNLGDAGGRKSGITWRVLSTWATGSPAFFAAYVRDPKAKNPEAQMEGSPEYDGETLRALIAYFRTFSEPRPRP